MSDNWLMGALAAQDAYTNEPEWPPAPRELTEREQVDAANAAAAQRLARPYARANAESQSNLPAVADFLKPETPLDYALMGGIPGAGLIGQGVAKIPKAIRMGMIAAGAGTTASEAEAGPTKAAKKVAEKVTGRGPAPTAPGEVLKVEEDVSAAAPYITSPLRVANPGVYKRPDVIAREAAENVAPEHPALKHLFGVTRDDLYQISQQGRRQGNVEPEIWMPSRPGKVNYAAEAIMTPANAKRMVDTLSEAEKYPELIKGMDPWYVMDPMYQELVRLFGKERAKTEYVKLNATIGPFSAGSNVMTEINRGTAANMAVTRGDYPTFQRFAGVAEKDRGADYPEWLRDVKGHAYHGIQARPVASWMETGKHAYENDTVKIPLYMQASGVPETGFQTRLPVPDAHFTRASGMPDARRQQAFNEYMGGTEYRPYGSWFRENVAKPLGIEAVPAQARMWGTYAPQTGVDTAIGAGKLELISQAIWERALKLGIDPKVLRDQVLSGKAHATLGGGGMIGGVAAMDEYERD